MRKTFLLPSLLLASAGLPLSAQSTTLFNGGFEIPDAAFGETSPEGWNFLNFGQGGIDDTPEDDFVRRRTLTDGQSPPPVVRTGDASLMISGGGDQNFRGALNSSGQGDLGGIDRRLAYTPFGQEVRITGYFNIPASNAWQVQRPGFKIEFRRPDGTNFAPTGGAAVGPEFFFVEPVSDGGTGHNNGEWEKFELVMDHWYIEQFQRRYGDGTPGEGDQGTIFFLLPFLFGGQSDDPQAPDFIGNETGACFYDDFSYEFEIGNSSPQQNRKLYADRQHQVEVELDPSSANTPIQIFFNQNNPDTPSLGTPLFMFWASNYWDLFDAAWDFDTDGVGGENWTTVNIYDRVPGWDQDATGEFQFQTGWFGYPLTWQDNVVDGRLYPRVQSDDGGVADLVNQTGSTGSPGTGVVTAPSYETNPLNFATYTAADIRTTANDLEADGMQDARGDTTVVVAGTYPGSVASIDASRDYTTDAQVGTTTNTFTYSFTANSPITLSGAFRLATLESFYQPGNYLARAVDVEGSVLELSAATPGANLFVSPAAFGVGDTVTLLNDTDGTPSDAPTVSLTLDALSGATGLGVQGVLALDGTLEVWVEWTGAPATIASSTTIDATFTVTATAPASVIVCEPDLNDDGVLDFIDYVVFQALAQAGDLAVDFDGTNMLGAGDFTEFENLFNLGCD